MRTRATIKNWLQITISIALLIAALSIFAVPVIAADPPPTPVPTQIEVTCCPDNVPLSPGSLGTTFDIEVLGQVPPEPDLKKGWCASLYVNIPLNDCVPTPYTATLYDYFGRYYSSYLSYLPDAVKTNPGYLGSPPSTINWKAISYIINNKMGNWADVQYAIYYFSDGYNLPSPLTPGQIAKGVNAANVSSMISAAQANPAFIPGEDQLRPIICYVPGKQCLFFEYQGSIPAYPTPELPAGVLLSAGLIGIGCFIYLKRRSMTTTCG